MLTPVLDLYFQPRNHACMPGQQAQQNFHPFSESFFFFFLLWLVVCISWHKMFTSFWSVLAVSALFNSSNKFSSRLVLSISSPFNTRLEVGCSFELRWFREVDENRTQFRFRVTKTIWNWNYNSIPTRPTRYSFILSRDVNRINLINYPLFENAKKKKYCYSSEKAPCVVEQIQIRFTNLRSQLSFYSCSCTCGASHFLPLSRF